MVLQLLVPGVQHQQRGRVDILFFHFVPDRLPRAAHQQPVQLAAVAQHQMRQPIGDREDDLKVVDARQHQLAAAFGPVGSPRSGTLRTVPLAARVVDCRPRVTAGTFIQTTEQLFGTAQRDLAEYTLNLPGDFAGQAQKRRRVLSQQVDYSRPGLRRRLFSLRPELRRRAFGSVGGVSAGGVSSEGVCCFVSSEAGS